MLQKSAALLAVDQGIMEQPILLKINRKDEKNSGERLCGHASYWLNL